MIGAVMQGAQMAAQEAAQAQQAAEGIKAAEDGVRTTQLQNSASLLNSIKDVATSIRV